MDCIPLIIFLTLPAIPHNLSINRGNLLLREYRLPHTAVHTIYCQICDSPRPDGERRFPVGSGIILNDT